MRRTEIEPSAHPPLLLTMMAMMMQLLLLLLLLLLLEAAEKVAAAAAAGAVGARRAGRGACNDATLADAATGENPETNAIGAMDSLHRRLWAPSALDVAHIPHKSQRANTTTTFVDRK